MRVWLLTHERGDYNTQPVTIRVYETKAKADDMLGKFKRWYDRQPAFHEEDEDWWAKHEAWVKRCPIKDADSGYSGFGAWNIQEMRVC